MIINFRLLIRQINLKKNLFYVDALWHDFAEDNIDKKENERIAVPSGVCEGGHDPLLNHMDIYSPSIYIYIYIYMWI